MNEKKPECNCPACTVNRRGPWGKDGQEQTYIPIPALTQQEKDEIEEGLANAGAFVAAHIIHFKHLEAAASAHKAIGDEEAASFYNCIMGIVSFLSRRECAGLTLAEMNMRYKGSLSWIKRKLAEKNKQKAEAVNADTCPGCGQPHDHKHDGADYPDSL